ncbi:MAG: pro-sigmaK processing inhibitor BofA family protein [Lachnospiraceae bacterium]
MNYKTEFFFIIAVCAIVLLIGAFRRKSEVLINFILRTVFGMIGIYFINQILLYQHIEVSIGLNPLTALTSGILGLPGVAALFGIGFYRFL